MPKTVLLPASKAVTRRWSDALAACGHDPSYIELRVHEQQQHELFAQALTLHRLLGGGDKFLRMSMTNRRKTIDHVQHRANPRSDHIHNARWRAVMETFTALRVAAALETT